MNRSPLLIFLVCAGIIFSFANPVRACEPKQEKTSADPPENPFHVYVSVNDRHTILHYTGNYENGNLSLADSVYVDGTCGSLTISPDKKFLYAAVRSGMRITTFRIGRPTGSLSFVSTIDAAGNPVYLSTDNQGRYLLSAYYSDNKVAVYRRYPWGSLQPEALQVLDVPPHPHCIRTDPSGRFVFVPVLGADRILQFVLDTASGPLRPNDPPYISTAQGCGTQAPGLSPFPALLLRGE